MNVFIMQNSIVRPLGRDMQNVLIGFVGEHEARTFFVRTRDDLTGYTISLVIGDVDCGAMTKAPMPDGSTMLSLTLTSDMLGKGGDKVCQLLMVKDTIVRKSSQFRAYVGTSNDINSTAPDSATIIIISAKITELVHEAALDAIEEVQEVIDSIPADYTALSTQVSQLQANLGDYEVMSLSSNLLKFSIISSGKWNVVSSTSGIRSSVTKIPNGVKKIRVEGLENEAQQNTNVIAFLKTYTPPTHGASPDFSDNYTGRISIEPGEVKEYMIEPDMRYIYTKRVTSDGYDCTPSVMGYFLNSVKQVSGLRNELTYELTHSFADDKVYNYTILNSGLWSVVISGTARSSIVKIPPNCVKIIVKPTGENSVFAFLKGQSYPWHNGVPEMSESYQSRITITEEVSYDRQTDMRFIYVQRINNSAEDITPDLTFVCTRSDAESDLTYVAFGASTTVGAVHHYDGTNITYTYLNYPAVVGERLGLKTYNNAHGSTGFLARGSSGTTPNHLDSIMDASDELSRASLISILFGYGNDYTAGLPVGEWDDYYPYDETGYHPSGPEGVAEMLSKGITVMGALNWCIRYLQTNYPKAQLVIIFGAPSANRYRDVSLSAQTPSAGSAPYKLNIIDPYDNPTGRNVGIKKISEEMAKLQKAINIPMIDAFSGGGTPFSWYATRAVDADGNYAVFSTTGSASAPEWNAHLNEDGYLVYGRYIAGLITSQFVR